MKNYYIKEGYKHKLSSKTAVDNGSEYWSEYRLSSSKYYQYQVYQLARDLIVKNNFKSCVDVGCGSGYKLVHLISPVCDDITGIDQPFIIDRCKQKYADKNVSWMSDDFENPKKDFSKKYDLIICSDVIEHLVDPDILLKYLKSIANKDSVIIISTPERDVLYGKDNNEALNIEHVREWNQAELTQYLTSEGLKVEKIHLMKPIRFHLHRRYFSHLKAYFDRFNYCMTAVCRIEGTSEKKM